MKVEVQGGSAKDQRRVVEAAARVGDVLLWDDVVQVTIGIWPGATALTEACANVDGVWLKPVVIANGPPGREQYILYEEFAHHVLSKMGVGHNDIFGVYFQELFAAYVQFSLHSERSYRNGRNGTDHHGRVSRFGRVSSNSSSITPRPRTRYCPTHR